MIGFNDVPTNWPSHFKAELSRLNEDDAVQYLAQISNIPKLLQCLKSDVQSTEWALKHTSLLNKVKANILATSVFRERIDDFIAGLEAIKALQASSSGPQSFVTQLTTRNCANLLADAYMKDMLDDNGNRLEGNSFSASMQFFTALLDEIDPSESDPLIKGKIDELKVKVREASELSRQIELAALESSSETHVLRDKLKIIAASIGDKIKALDPGESLLLPYGYQNYPSGHAMLCQVTKMPNGRFECLVFNTGDGIQFHQKIQSVNTLSTLPVVAYENIEEEKIVDPEFLELYLEPLTVRSVEKFVTPYSANEMYLGVFSRFEKDAVPVSADKSRFIIPQRAGSCSMRVLMAYLRETVGEQAYNRLEFKMNKAVVTALMNDVDKLSNDKTRRSILENGIQALCRSALKLYPEIVQPIHNIPTSSSSFIETYSNYSPNDYPELNEVVQLASNVEAVLEMTTPPIQQHPPVVEVPEVLNLNMDLVTITDIGLNNEFVRDNSTKAVSTQTDPANALFIPVLQDHFTTGQDLANYIDNLKDFAINADKTRDEKVAWMARSHIKEAVLKIPLPTSPQDAESVWGEIADPQACLNSLSLLMKGFCNIQRTHGLRPEEEIAMEKMLAFAHYLACRLDRAREIQGASSTAGNYLDQLRVSRRYLKKYKESAIMSQYRIGLNTQIDEILNYFNNPAAHENAPQLWDYENDYAPTDRREYSKHGKPFIFPPASGEWTYLAQFERMIPSEDIVKIREFFKKIWLWREESNSGRLSYPVQALWAGRVEGYPPELSEHQKLVPDHFRQIVGLSLLVNNEHRRALNNPYTTSESLNLWTMDESLILPTLSVEIVKRPNYADESIPQLTLQEKYRQFSVLADPSMTMLTNLNYPSMPYISKSQGYYQELSFSTYKSFVDLLDTLSLEAPFLSVNHRTIEDINKVFLEKHFTFSKLKDGSIMNILIEAYYSKSLRASATIELLKQNALSPSAGLQYVIGLLLFSEDNLSHELTSEPTFGQQLLDFIDRRSTHLLRKIAENGVSSTSKKEFVLEYVFLHHLKGHILERMHVLSGDLENKILENRSSYHSFMREIENQATETVMREMRAIYVSMFINTPPVNEEELSEIFLNYAKLMMSSQKAGDYVMNEMLWDNVKDVYSENSGRFRTLLENPAVRNRLFTKIARENASLDVPETASWDGAYPHFTAIVEGDTYSIDLTNWKISRNGTLPDDINVLYAKAEYKFLFGTGKFDAYNSFSYVNQHRADFPFIGYEAHDDDGIAVRFMIKTYGDVKIQKDFDGVPHLYIPWEETFGKKGLMIALEKQPNHERYVIWKNNDSNILRVTDRETKQTVCFIHEDGSLIFPEREVPACNSVDVEKNPSTAFLANFDEPAYISALCQGSTAQSPFFDVSFQRYRAANGEAVSFSRKEIALTDPNRTQSVLMWNNSPGFFIDPDQKIEGLENFHRYIVVRNGKGQRKLLVPIREFGKSSDQSLENTFEVLTMPIRLTPKV